MNPADKPKPKKPYRPPVLERYGDIRTLTRIVNGQTGASDHVPMGNKTAP